MEGYALSTVISMMSFTFDHDLPSTVVPTSEMRKERHREKG